MYLINEKGSLDLSPDATLYTPGRTPRRQSAAVIQRTPMTLWGSNFGSCRFSRFLSRVSNSFFMNPRLLCQESDRSVPQVCQGSGRSLPQVCQESDRSVPQVFQGSGRSVAKESLD